MKTYSLIFGFILVLGCSVKEAEEKQIISSEDQSYDSLLAAETGADAYGMRK